METGIGTRIRTELRRLEPSLTQKELAAEIGMTPDALSRALSGERNFSAAEVAALSARLRVSMYWLATGEQDPHQIVVAARHGYDAETMEYLPAEAEVMDRIAREIDLVYRQAFPGETTPETRLSAVETVRDALPNCFVREFATSIESTLGIDVVRVDSVTRAFSIFTCGRDVIVIGESGNWFYQNWSMAHELGHIVRGHTRQPPLDMQDENAREAEANAFAAELLMPATEVKETDWTTVSPAKVAQLVWDWGISTSALRIRLQSLGCRTSADLQGLLNMKTQTLLRQHLPETMGRKNAAEITARMNGAAKRRFPDHLQAAHRDQVAQGRAPKASLAWMLGVDPEDVEVDEPSIQVASIDVLANQLGFEI